MEVPQDDDPRVHDIDRALRVWRQGDCVLGEQWFVHRFDPEYPLTDASAADASAGVDLTESAVLGFVVLTQTCDLLFTSFVSTLHTRLLEKHDKQSDEGRALRALREIRVQADPSWEAPEVELTFWFIHEEGVTNFEGTSWDIWLDHWLNFLPQTGRFVDVSGLSVTLADMTAKDYVESDPLDLDYLSSRAP